MWEAKFLDTVFLLYLGLYKWYLIVETSDFKTPFEEELLKYFVHVSWAIALLLAPTPPKDEVLGLNLEIMVLHPNIHIRKIQYLKDFNRQLLVEQECMHKQ